VKKVKKVKKIIRNNPGGTGSAVSKMPGESASAAYVRHERLYLNNVSCHN